MAKYIYTYKNYTGSLKDIIDHFNLDINCATINKRLSRGMTLEEAIEKSFNKRNKVYTYNGFTGTVKEISDYFNLDINLNSIRYRLRNGMSVEEAFEVSNNKIIYCYNSYCGTISEIINYHKLTMTSRFIQKRIRSGMSISEAIETPIEQNNLDSIFQYRNFKGTLAEIIKHYNLKIDEYELNDKLAIGMTLKEAIESTLVNNDTNIYSYKGFEGTTYQIIKHFNLKINKNTLKYRLNKGVNIEKAIETEVRKKKIYHYNGFIGNSSDFIKKFNLEISNQTFAFRVDSGESIDEAIYAHALPIKYVKKLKDLSIKYNVDLIELYELTNNAQYNDYNLQKLIKILKK